jgi:dimethylargininase
MIRRPPTHAIVRRPSPRLAEGELTHIDRRPLDLDRALAQHRTYVELLAGHGLAIVAAPDAPEHPDGLFVEDALVVVDRVAVLTRPGATSRRAEVDSLVTVVEQLGLHVRRLHEPATLDGGDVLVTDRHVFVGRSSRTNDAGIAQLAALVGDRDTVGVDVDHCLHLKSAITALPDGSLVAVPGWVDRGVFESRGYVVHDAADDTGGDALCLGSTVVLPASAQPTADQLRRSGFTVETLDVGELQKLEAGVTCMSVLV